MRTFRLSVAASMLLVLHSSFGADNVKQIETAMRNHREAITKAEELRVKAVEKSRTETVAQLARLASRAYAEKDRLAETNAWKAVLAFDRKNAKAVRYFQDLGTLEKVLQELPPEAVDAKDVFGHFTGKWITIFPNGIEHTMEFTADGKAKFQGFTTFCECTVDATYEGLAIAVTSPAKDVKNRYTLMGTRMLVEQWIPPAAYPKAVPYYGFATRAK